MIPFKLIFLITQSDAILFTLWCINSSYPRWFRHLLIVVCYVYQSKLVYVINNRGMCFINHLASTWCYVLFLQACACGTDCNSFFFGLFFFCLCVSHSSYSSIVFLLKMFLIFNFFHSFLWSSFFRRLFRVSPAFIVTRVACYSWRVVCCSLLA